MLQEIIDIGLKTTSFIFVIKEEEYVQIFEDVIADIHIATFEIEENNKILISLERFDEWKQVHEILKFGKAIVDSHPKMKRVIFETYDEMEEEVIQLYESKSVVWYVPYGYIPYFPKWNEDKIKDFYQLPFMKPQDFLDLDYGHQLIFPMRISYQKYSDPIHLHCQKEPSSIRFRTLPETSFYRSKRPINSMCHLRQKSFRVIDTSKIPNYMKSSGAPLKIKDRYYVPVVRYSLGMKHGCYFDPVNSNSYLGTFYYWEPDSNIYLDMGSKFEYFNSKMECADQLRLRIMDISVQNNPELSETVLQLFRDLERNIQKINRDMVRELYRFYEEEVIIFEKNLGYENADEEELEEEVIADLHRIYSDNEPRYLPIDKSYKSTISGEYMKKLFYAAEDELDQAIAKALVFFGYETVIFGKMAGNYRIVSEVLDVRTRESSLSNLCWTFI